MKGGYSRKSVLTGLASFLIVLFTMPLGHAFLWRFIMQLSRWELWD